MPANRAAESTNSELADDVSAVKVSTVLAEDLLKYLHPVHSRRKRHRNKNKCFMAWVIE
jgi:hypothetical protein